VLEAATFSFRLGNLASVGQPIEHDPDKSPGAKHFGQVLKRPVSRHHQVEVLADNGHYCEKRLRTNIGREHVIGLWLVVTSKCLSEA